MTADGWPPHAHTGDPETSHAAAALLDPTNDVRTIVRFFVTYDREHGWTYEELTRAPAPDLLLMDNRNAGLRKRLSDAEQRGLVGPVTLEHDPTHIVTRRSRYNRRQRALRITDAGRDWLAGAALGRPTNAAKAARKRRSITLTEAERAALGELRRQSDGGGLVMLDDELLDALDAILERLGA